MNLLAHRVLCKSALLIISSFVLFSAEGPHAEMICCPKILPPPEVISSGESRHCSEVSALLQPVLHLFREYAD